MSILIPEVFNVWNHFDEMGLILGLPRNRGERNVDYKARLLEVYVNPADSTHTGLKNGISRELGLSVESVEIYRLSDLINPLDPNNILNEDGNAIGTKLEDYAKEVYDHNPIFWGNIIADEGYWDGVDIDSNGYTFLPHIWDPNASGIYDKWQMPGIGDQDDLWIADPISVWNDSKQDYSWYLPIHSGYFYAADASGYFGF